MTHLTDIITIICAVATILVCLVYISELFYHIRIYDFSFGIITSGIVLYLINVFSNHQDNLVLFNKLFKKSEYIKNPIEKQIENQIEKSIEKCTPKSSDILKQLYEVINKKPIYSNWKFRPIDTIVLIYSPTYNINFADIASTPSTPQPDIIRILAYVPETQLFFMRNAYKYQFGIGSIDRSTIIKQISLEEVLTLLCV